MVKSPSSNDLSQPAAPIKHAVRKRRNRVQLTCDPCRRAKLKCDRDQPSCDQVSQCRCAPWSSQHSWRVTDGLSKCCKRSRESVCHYTEQGLKHMNTVQKRESMREKMERLELFLSSVQESQPSGDLVMERGLDNATDIAREICAASKDGGLRVSKSGSSQWVAPSNWQSIIHDVSCSLCQNPSDE